MGMMELSAPEGRHSSSELSSSSKGKWQARACRTVSTFSPGLSGPDFTRRFAHFYLGLFIPLFAFLVLANSRWNARIDDTLLLISNFEALQRFSSLWSNANADPLQALFDIFPSGHRLDTLPGIIGARLFGPGMHIDFFLSFCGPLLAGAVVVLGRALGLRWAVSVLAGVLLPFMIMPTIGSIPLAEDLYVLWPVLYYSAAIITLITALYWQI